MRIISGRFRGRPIQAPSGTRTRPTTDRVREALFSSIVSRMGGSLEGITVADAFAGSGALGLEAISRGAAFALFFEPDAKARAALNANIRSLGVEAVCRVQGTTFQAGARAPLVPSPSLILLDPPYTLDAHLVADALVSLTRLSSVESGALVAWEHSSETQVPWPEAFVVLSAKRYGTTTIDLAVFEGSPKP